MDVPRNAGKPMGKASNVYDHRKNAVRQGTKKATALAEDAYNSVLDWADNAEISRWLTNRLSDQASSVAAKL